MTHTHTHKITKFQKKNYFPFLFPSTELILYLIGLEISHALRQTPHLMKTVATEIIIKVTFQRESSLAGVAAPSSLISKGTIYSRALTI